MKSVFILFFALTVSCQANQDSAKQMNLDPDNQKRLQKKVLLRNIIDDSLAFLLFEKQVRNEDTISLDIIRRFVNLKDSTTFNSNSKYMGKSDAIRSNYKFFYIKQGYKENGTHILLTFNPKNNKIIDQKNIIAYCNPCKTNALESTISFSSRSDELIEVIIEYLKPTESKAMPLFNDPNLVKRETWIVDTKGFFILKE